MDPEPRKSADNRDVRVLSTFFTGRTVEKLADQLGHSDKEKVAYPSPISPSFMIVPLAFCLSRHVDLPDAGLAVVGSNSIFADVGV